MYYADESVRLTLAREHTDHLASDARSNPAVHEGLPRRTTTRTHRRHHGSHLRLHRHAHA